MLLIYYFIYVEISVSSYCFFMRNLYVIFQIYLFDSLHNDVLTTKVSKIIEIKYEIA